MQIKPWTLLAAAAVLGACFFGGCECPGGGGLSVPVAVGLPSSVGSFAIQDGETIQQRGVLTIPNNSGVTPGSGSLEISSDDLSATPSSTLMQATGGTVTVTAWIDSSDNVETVCGGGEQYGPYTVTLDSGGNIVSINPDLPQNLSANTISLINSGAVSLCFSVTSNGFNGTFVISSITLNLGL